MMSTDNKNSLPEVESTTINLIDEPLLLEDILKLLFAELSDVSHDSQYNILFCDRDPELRELLTALEYVSETGRNILIIGDAGCGKTSFIRKLLADPKVADESVGVAQFIDLRKIIYTPPGGSVLSLVERLLVDYLAEYFNQIGQVPAIGPLNRADEVSNAYYTCFTHLNRLDRDKGDFKPLFLFVDDIDYTDTHDMPGLLSVLSPVLESPNAVVILAARPPVYRAISHAADTRVRRLFSRGDKILTLPHLDVELVLAARLDAVLRFRQLEAHERTALDHHIEKLTAQRSYRDFFRKFRLDIDMIQRIVFPFTRRQLSLMQSLSNGNVRTVFSMARAYLKYMALNRDKLRALQHLNEDDKGFYVGRDAVFEIFSKDYDKYSSGAGSSPNCRLINLNERRSHGLISAARLRAKGIPASEIGNSLCVVLLETLQRYTVVDGSFYELLESYGFTKSETKEGLRLLEEDYEMIEERTIRNIGGTGSDVERPVEYVIRSRGQYYVDYLIRWGQYREAFGESTHHKRVNANQAKDLRIASLDLLLQIWEAIGQSVIEFLISKKAFYELYVDYYGKPVTGTFGLGNEGIVVDSEDIAKVLIELNIVKQRDPKGKPNLVFQTGKLRDACVRCGIEMKALAPHSAARMKEFVEAYVTILK